MSAEFIETVKAVEKLLASTQHEHFAAKFLNIATSNVILLVQSYGVMQEKQPIKYQDEITTGRMLRNFKKAINHDQATADNILVIANHRKLLEDMTRAVKHCNVDTNITEEASERAALDILTNLLTNGLKYMEFKRAAKAKIQELLCTDNNLELVEAELESVLHSNYLK
jgi:hypothetical protein